MIDGLHGWGTVAVEGVLKGVPSTYPHGDLPFPGAAVRMGKRGSSIFHHVSSQEAAALFFSLGHEPQICLEPLRRRFK